MDFTTIVVDKILNIYPYGSRVYGTNKPNSDYDYIVVVKGQDGKNYQVINGEYNLSVYDEKAFQRLIDNHEISVLECLCLPKEIVVQEDRKFEFKIDKSKLRNSFSQKASNSWVKAKKKLTVEKDFDEYTARKSIFHSLRIWHFGIQLATENKIYDFSDANYLWDEINKVEGSDWEDFNSKFKTAYNALATQFRIVAPK